MQSEVNARSRGFTLVELLVVIGIIAALAAVVIPNVSRFVGSGDAEANNTEAQTVQAAMDLYMAENGLLTVTANGTVSPFAGGVNNFETSNPQLFPAFLRQNPTKCLYVWLDTGQVTQDPNC